MLIIESDYKKINRNDWISFVNEHPKGSIFQIPEFYFSCKNLKYDDAIVIFAIDSSNNKLVGIIAGLIQREYKGILGFFTSRCIVIGEPLALNNSFLIQKELILNFDKQISKKVIFSQFRFTNRVEDKLINYLKKNNYKYEPHLNIIINTSIGYENLWKEIKRNRKDGINKGKKQEFIFLTSGYNIEVFYSLLKSTYWKAKKPFPKIEYFHSLNDHMVHDMIKIFELKYKDNIIISLFSFIYKDKLYAYYIGIYQDPKLLNLRPVDYFYWEVIKWCSENGIKYFDWMGAGNKNEDYGVRDFKKQYGGIEFEPGRMSKFHNIFIKFMFHKLLYFWEKINYLISSLD